jgi:Domain of unknown function (DUF4082)
LLLTTAYQEILQCGKPAGPVGKLGRLLMTIYNPVRDSGPASPSVTNDATQYVFGLSFKISSACVINGIWWYVSSTQYTNSAGTENIALWQWNGTQWAYVTGSMTAAGTYSTGWNLLSFSSPVSLSASTSYMAVKAVDGNRSNLVYSSTGNFFSSGGAGQNGFSEGPVTVYSSSNPNGTSNQEPWGIGQCVFIPATITVNTALTSNSAFSTFNAGWYGLDVQISTTSTLQGTATLSASSALAAAGLNTAVAKASLSAPGMLTATAVVTPSAQGVTLDSLWAIYVAAAANWASVLDYWRMAASVSRTDGTAGYIYTQVYEAEQAKDNAWIAWDTLRKKLFPAPPSQPGRPD